MRLCVKIWLEQGGGKAFGDGAADLLERVRRTGALAAAAAEIGMSYSQAWRLVRGLEARLGFALLEAQAGGAAGGASRLSSRATEWLDAYGRFRSEAQALIVQTFSRHFSGLVETYEVAEPGRRESGPAPEPAPGGADPGGADPGKSQRA